MNTSDPTQFISSLDSKIKTLFASQEKLQQALQTAKAGLASLDPMDDQTRDRFRQLVLQLRLDNEDTLRALIALHNSYCSALGISPLNSELTNLERLQYSLGEDNVKLELLWLHDLIDKLEATFNLSEKLHRAYERQRKQREKLERLRDRDEENIQAPAQEWEHAPSKAMENVAHELANASELQTQFQFSIEQLTESLQAYEGLPKFGLIHDYLAGLEGPISRFFMAAQNGLSVVDKLAHIVKLEHHHSQAKTDLKQQILDLMKRLERSQLQTRADLQRLYRLEHPAPTPPTQDDTLAQRMHLRRTLKMFP